MSRAETIAAVLARHRLTVQGCHCGAYEHPGSHPMLDAHEAHVAAALAAYEGGRDETVLREAARRYEETEAGPGDHAAAWLRAEADRAELQQRAGTVAEAVERLLASRLTWGVHADRWSDTGWQRRFWTEVAQVALGVEVEDEVELT